MLFQNYLERMQKRIRPVRARPVNYGNRICRYRFLSRKTPFFAMGCKVRLMLLKWQLLREKYRFLDFSRVAWHARGHRFKSVILHFLSNRLLRLDFFTFRLKFANCIGARLCSKRGLTGLPLSRHSFPFCPKFLQALQRVRFPLEQSRISHFILFPGQSIRFLRVPAPIWIATNWHVKVGR